MVSEGIVRIADERARQIIVEKYSIADDVQQNNAGELIKAALCYLMPTDTELVSSFWPWDWDNWKPTPNNRLRELEKAGALIVAEIDRLFNQSSK